MNLSLSASISILAWACLLANSSASAQNSTAAASICMDNAEFSYKKKVRTCAQIQSKEDLRQKFCLEAEVLSNCPLTCGKCCGDDPDFQFEIKSGTMKSCEWLAANELRQEKWCNPDDTEYENFENRDLISTSCRSACDNCLDPVLEETESPSALPSVVPTTIPSTLPSVVPSVVPSTVPSTLPSVLPSVLPSTLPSVLPSVLPSTVPSALPSVLPSTVPSTLPSKVPSELPSTEPSDLPSVVPSDLPTQYPSTVPTALPTSIPTALPSDLPSNVPSLPPTSSPSDEPSSEPSHVPSMAPTKVPSDEPSLTPTVTPSAIPTRSPSMVPSAGPTITTPEPTVTCVDTKNKFMYKGEQTRCKHAITKPDANYCSQPAFVTLCPRICMACKGLVPAPSPGPSMAVDTPKPTLPCVDTKNKFLVGGVQTRCKHAITKPEDNLCKKEEFFMQCPKTCAKCKALYSNHPSSVPSFAPSESPSDISEMPSGNPSITCVDHQGLFFYGGNERGKCLKAGKDPKYCENAEFASFCPKSCGVCKDL